MAREERGEITVVLDIFSGRPNPDWTLSDGETDELRHLLQASRTHRMEAAPARRSLGYAGFVIFNPGGVPGIPHRVRVHRGIVAVTERPREAGKGARPRPGKDGVSPPRTEHYADHYRLEVWLLEQAARRGWAETIAEGGGPRRPASD